LIQLVAFNLALIKVLNRCLETSLDVLYLKEAWFIAKLPRGRNASGRQGPQVGKHRVGRQLDIKCRTTWEDGFAESDAGKV
jgi:hypothetical protein